MLNKKVVIFGVFDGIHSGHLSFIKNAKKEGDTLVAIVARDDVVKELKGKIPKYDEEKRINDLLKVNDIDLVLLGDAQLGTYNILREVNPSVIYVGYDQQALFQDLNKFIKNGNFPEMKIICGQPYKPELFHSSILNKK